MSDPVLGPTEVWDTDAITEIEASLMSPRKHAVPRPFRCRTGAVPGTRGTSRRVLHYLLPGDKAADGVPQLYISPLVGDSSDAILLLGRLIMELTFPRLGAEGVLEMGKHLLGIQWDSRTPVPIPASGRELPRLVPEIIAALGPRPHGAVVVPEQVRKPKATALCKIWCPFCLQPGRFTLTALSRAWPVCVGNGLHAPVYVIGESGTQKAGAQQQLRASDFFTTNFDSLGYPIP